MKTYHKIIGNMFEKWIEVTINFSHWMIGFGWVKHCVYFNFGPLAVIIGWGE